MANKAKPKPRLKVVPITDGHWANPKEVDKAVVEINKLAAEHKLKSVTIVGEMMNGVIYTRSSRTDNAFAVAAQYLMMAMRIMGFKDNGK